MDSYLDEYIDDLYKLKISVLEVSKKEKVSRKQVDEDINRSGFSSPRSYYQKINTGFVELDYRMKQRYNSIVTRCNGNTHNKHHNNTYKGLDYLPIYEWVDLCNNNKETLLRLWQDYKEGGKPMRLAISIDRINDNFGYTKNNLQFVTHGFNAWKRNNVPLLVTHEGNTKYFMSGEEAGNYYGIRTQSISDILRGQKRLVEKEYQPKTCSESEVLKHNNCDDLEDYYEEVFFKNQIKRPAKQGR